MLKFVVIAFYVICVCATFANDEAAPQIITKNGHLIFMTGEQRNISFQTRGSGHVLVNNLDLNEFSAKHNSLDQVQTSLHNMNGNITKLRRNYYRLSRRLRKKAGRKFLRRLNRKVYNITTDISNIRIQIAHEKEKIDRVITNVASVITKLQQDECTSNPCLNGGTCVDMYDSFKCLCPSQWQGHTCNVDVNECVTLAGTPEGCSQPDTDHCHNFAGGFSCFCKPNHYGVLCDRLENSCDANGDAEMCLHGHCIPTHGAGGEASHSCICHPGWKTGDTKACDVDIDECTQGRHPCSETPKVPCINTLGSFQCGMCPSGYEGNGFNCEDIDECVTGLHYCGFGQQCVNTEGSYDCECPPGTVVQNGICVLESPCQQADHGGCHPLAQCVPDNNMFERRRCVCPTNYIGNGVGPQGCLFNSQGGGSSYSSCVQQGLCNNGVCQRGNNDGFSCVCNDGYTGQYCDRSTAVCSPNPCLNGGSCFPQSGMFSCRCASNYYGTRCEVQLPNCGGDISGNSQGTLHYYHNTTSQYVSNQPRSCHWTISAPTIRQVISLTFLVFELQPSTANCDENYLLIEDVEPPSLSIRSKKFCQMSSQFIYNVTTPKVSLTATISGDWTNRGFILRYKVFDPPRLSNCCTCVNNTISETNSTSGTFRSLFYPHRYPVNARCSMRLVREFGMRRRVNLHYRVMRLGNNCNNQSDSLTIRLSDNTIRRFDGCSSLTIPDDVTTEFEAQFSTDSRTSQSETGFLISWSEEPTEDVCGGVLISSTNFTFTVPNLEADQFVDCSWEARLVSESAFEDRSFKISIQTGQTFTGCQLYFEIYQTLDTAPRKICLGDSVVVNLEARSISRFYVRFVKSRESGARVEPFSLTAEKVCSRQIILSTTPVILTSPGFPLFYSRDLSCTYNILPSSDMDTSGNIIMELHLIDIPNQDVSSCSDADYLQMNSTEQGLQYYCNSFPPHKYLTLGNEATIVFQTDSSTQNGRGFFIKLSYRNCGKVFSLMGHWSQLSFPDSRSSGHLATYRHNIDCEWDFYAESNKTIVMRILDFNLESSGCRYDYLDIYDSDRKLGRFCGTKIRHYFLSGTSRMRLVFHSDSSVNRDGFAVAAGAINREFACNYNINVAEGQITEALLGDRAIPFYCRIFINAPQGSKIVLNITLSSNSTEPASRSSSSCYSINSLLVYDGISSPHVLGRFCHGGATSAVLETSSHTADIAVRSYYFNSEPLKFRVTFYPIQTGTCGSKINAMRGGISSPNYPLYHGAQTNCFWEIFYSSGYQLSLSVRYQLPTNCDGSDFLLKFFYESRDGRQIVEKQIDCSESLSHSNSFRNQINIKTHQKYPSLKVLYKTGTSLPARFQATFYQSCMTEITHTPHGTLSSEGYPTSLIEDQYCSWKIVAPKGNKVRIVIGHFDLPINSTAAKLILKGTTNGTVELTNSQLNQYVFESTDQNLTVKFETCSMCSGAQLQELQQYSGFSLDFRIEGCIYHFTESDGVFTSPNYPAKYSENMECYYMVEAPIGKSISFDFVDIDLEHNDKCLFDYLEIFDGQTFDSNLKNPIGKYCQQKSDDKMKITTSYNRAVVHFVSDSGVNHNGFKITYKFINYTCNKTLHAPTGIVKSPNYPTASDHNQDCYYDIAVPKSSMVLFNFSNIEMEGYPYDYITILGNSYRPSQIITSQTPYKDRTFSTDRSDMMLHYHTDGTISSKGFLGKFYEGCGGTLHADSSRQLLTTPNYPSSYRNSCEWFIVSENERIVFFIESISFWSRTSSNCSAATFDYLAVFEGDSQSGEPILKLCSGISEPIVSASRSITVRFVPRPMFGSSFMKAFYGHASTACTGVYDARAGYLASPHYPANVAQTANCLYQIKGSYGSTVTFSFRSLTLDSDVDCTYNYMELYEGLDLHGRLIKRFCSSDSNTQQTFTVNKDAFIRFYSSRPGTNSNYLIYYEKAYGRNYFNVRSGKIASPEYPRSYPNSMSVEWTIASYANETIMIQLEHLDLEFGRSFCYDNLMIMDGESQVAAVDCKMTSFDPIFLTSGLATIKFTSDSSVSRAGFLLNWTFVDPPSNYTTFPCNSTRDALNEDKFIYSPRYPNNYPSNIYCQWKIKVPFNRRLAIHVKTYNIETSRDCSFDKLIIKNWKQKPICGQGADLPVIFAGPFTSLVTIIFQSDSSVSRSGFRISFHLDCSVFDYRRATTSMRVTSPGYPLPSLPDAQCFYYFRVPRGRTINIKINDFHLPKLNSKCQSQLLMENEGRLIRKFNRNTFKNYGSGDGMIILNNSVSFCGEEKNIFHHSNSQLSDTLKLSTDQILLEFLANNSTVSKFSLNLEVEPIECNGHVSLTDNSPTASIKYPSSGNYDNSIECFWRVTAPPGKSIKMHFDNFDIGSRAASCTDFLEVYDGPTTIAPVLDKLCGTIHKNLISNSNSILLRLYTDAHGQGRGFDVKLSISECGGVLKSTSGSISSVSLPTAGKDIDCHWEVVAPVGHSIQFRFTYLNIGNCSLVSLNLSSLMKEAGLLKKSGVEYSACDLNIYSSFDIPTHLANISLRVSPGQVAQFRLTYEASKIECYREIDAPSGEITTPNYPNSTLALECIYIIRSPIGTRVKLQINAFDMPGYFLRIYNGRMDYKRMLIKSLYGRKYGDDTVNSTDHVMQIKIYQYSKRRVRLGSGFRATFTSNEPRYCGGDIYITEDTPYNITQLIESPEFSSHHNTTYKNNVYCEWVIHNLPRQNQSLYLSFNHFNLEEHRSCNYDSLEIINYNNLEVDGVSTQLVDSTGKLCNPETEKNYAKIISIAPLIKIIFVSDYTIQRSGFQLQLKRSNCGGYINDDFGEITSPGYPNGYPNGLGCLWIFHGSEEMRWNLTLADLRIEQHDLCQYDYIELRNGPYLSSPIIGKHCVNSDQQKTFITGGPFASVGFHSDLSISQIGFKLAYSTVLPDSHCGGTFHTPGVSLQTTNYGRQYPDNLRCHWVLLAPDGYQIKVKFQRPFGIDYSTGCERDALIVRNSNDSIIRSRLCGRDVPAPILSNLNRITLDFYSNNDAIALDGVKFDWEEVCGGMYTSERGTIISPDFPYMPRDIHTCTYTIRGEFDHVATVKVQNFSIPRIYSSSRNDDGCTENYLEVQYDNSHLRTRYCGTTIPSSFTHAGGITFKFVVSRRTYRKGGFKIGYFVSKCGGDYNVTYMMHIGTPQFPEPYHQGADCTWQLRAPPDRVIYLRFRKIGILPEIDCRDRLSIYNGLDTSNSSAMLDSLCGTYETQPPLSYNSNGDMSLRFRSSYRYGQNLNQKYSGFQAMVISTPSADQGCGTYRGWKVPINGGIIRPVDLDNDGKYDHYQACEWILETDLDRVVRIQFMGPIDLEGGGSANSEMGKCPWDYIEINDGGYPSSPLMGHFCSNASIPIITSTSNKLRIFFFADISMNGAGFSVNYTTLPSNSFHVVTANTSLESYSAIIEENQFERVQRIDIKAPQNERIFVSITDLSARSSSGCDLDYLFISDIDSKYGHQTRHLCDSNIHLPYQFESLSNEVMLTLYKGGNSDVPNQEVFVQLDYQLLSCSRTLTGRSGRVLSTNFIRGLEYKNSLDCYIKVEAVSDRANIQFYFRNFSLESSPNCVYDHLQFYLGSEVNNSVGLPKLCGTSLPNSFVSNTSQVIIHFKTDGSVNAAGFDITYVASDSGCGGNIFVPIGVLTSPNYGSGMYPASNCLWNLQAPAKKEIYIEVVDRDLDANSTLSFKVDGDSMVPSESALYKLPAGKMVEISFYSPQSNVNKRGFRILWDLNDGGRESQVLMQAEIAETD